MKRALISARTLTAGRIRVGFQGPRVRRSCRWPARGAILDNHNVVVVVVEGGKGR